MAFPSRRQRAIPSPDAGSFRRARFRTLVVRGLTVAAACGLLAAAFVSARSLEPKSSELTPGGRSGVVVIDLSLSIVNRDYGRVRNVLARLMRADNPMGLVVFSDTAYELLPPRTPAAELKPLLRFFRPGADGRLPQNPWTTSFQAGTRISSALALAQDMLVRDRVSPASILLLSDLETAPTDFTALGRTLSRIHRSSTTMRVAPLSASSESRALFESILGSGAFVEPVEPSAGETEVLDVSLSGEQPLWLLLAAGLCLAALAAHERFAGRLALPAGAGWRRL